MDLAIMEGMGAAACAALDDARPGLGMPFEAHLNPMELKLVRKLVGDLKPEDRQEEMHAWHLAVSHILAAQRFGKSRQEGLSERAGQIEVGLAVRLMALADRKSTSLDRHRAFRLKAADEADRLAAVRAYREAEAAKRAAEEAKQAEWAAWRRKRSDQRLPGDEQEAQEDRGEQAATQDHAAREAFEAPEANGNAGTAAAPVPSEAEAAAQLAWEQAIEAARPDPRDEEEEGDGEAADPVPARPPGSGSGPATAPEAGQAPLNRRQRRALARRAKKEALRAARGTS